MKRSPLVLFALLALIVAGFSGCASLQQNKQTAVSRPRSFALAVTVQGSLQPTPQQWAVIQAKVSRLLAARGWVLVTDISLADHILRIDFTPDPDNPEGAGVAKVLGVRSNPLSTVARQGTSPYPSGLGYASTFRSGWWGSSYYSGNFFSYGDPYYDGYDSSSYTPVVFTPSKPAPSHHPHPGNQDGFCPPPMIPAISGQFASNTTYTSPVNDHPRPPPSDYGRGAGEHAHARASSSSSYSRSDYSYSRPDSSFSSSSSSYSSYDSYSPPASSYSTDTSSSASNAAVTSTISSSAPSVGTVSSAH